MDWFVLALDKNPIAAVVALVVVTLGPLWIARLPAIVRKVSLRPPPKPADSEPPR